MILSRKYNLLAQIILCLFTALPLLAGFGYALLYSFGLIGVLKTGFTVENWAQVLTGSALSSFTYSILIAATGVFLAVALSVYVALRLHRFLQKGLLSYLIYIPLAFPGIVAAFFIFQMFTKAGIVSRLAYKLHLIKDLQSFPDLVNDRFGIGIILTFTFLVFPFFVLLFVNIIKSERLEEFRLAAATLGASRKNILWKVSLPLLLRRALPNIILYFIFIFGSFEVPLLLGRSNPEMVSVMAVRKLQRFNLLDLPQGYAIAVLYSLFVILVLYFLFKAKNRADEK